ncbi:hypothetical protein H2198_003856 [Neophaeococcomyces mojaviensis]|uniref:Uncharacterized protein n=1 Tax=Neophaeococcomyces mojaviensis TaxID=3383035 RepID=A0ACC3AA36_9EURO|nr:hypothetical protein H2198_003856 [Knufia sp. JES_112]
MNPEATVDTSIESCKIRITELDTELKNFKFKRDGLRSMRNVMSRTVRASYPFQADTIRKLRESISRINEILQQAASSVLIRQNNATQDTIDRFYTEEASGEIMRWLDPPNLVYSHLDASAKHRQNTGSWLLNSPEFIEWKKSRSSVLWIQGNAGCGKTVLCPTVIDNLIEECESTANSGMAYFYFDFNNQSIDQDHNRVLRSLIEQLSSQSGDIPKPLASLYQRCRKGSVQPLTSDLLKSIHNIIDGFSLFYLVIDGVDECKEKQEFLRFLNTVAQWKLPQVHVFATSRTDINTEIRNCKWSCVTVIIEKHLVDADIERHVFVTLDNDEILNGWDPGQQQAIATSLIKGANGNFKWVACQIGALRQCHTLAELEDVLNCLSATLEETYERALAVIDEQRREVMRNVLRWLSFSARPLRLEEIAEVMAVDFSAVPQPKHDVRKRLVNPQRFFQTYSSLFRILNVKTNGVEYQELRLAHLSLREYLVSPRIRGSPVSFYAAMSYARGNAEMEALLLANGYNLDTADSKLEETGERQYDEGVLQDIKFLLEERITMLGPHSR